MPRRVSTGNVNAGREALAPVVEPKTVPRPARQQLERGAGKPRVQRVQGFLKHL